MIPKQNTKRDGIKIILSDLMFFYLKEDSDGWKVTSCGTGH